VSALGTVFTATNFVFNTTLLSGTLINFGNIIGETSLLADQIYIARSLANYNGAALGMATSSSIGFANTYANFNFVFNKLFSEVSNEIYAGFNYTDQSQFGLAKPNRQRESEPSNVVDGYWSLKNKSINSAVSIYPRASLSTALTIGTSILTYSYLPYAHDMYLNLGYNSSGIYYQDVIVLNAFPRWKATWMERSSFSYKNFDIYDVITSTYIDSVDYQIGFPNTVIGITTNPKSAIFEGTFEPGGNLAITVPLSITIGTSSGVQMFVNNGLQPVIDSFSTISSGISTYTATLSVSERNSPVLFKVNYFTLSTAVIQINWDTGSGSTLINLVSCSNNISPSPVSINSGIPVENIVFMNVSKTLEEAQSINGGFPPGDSFVIRSS
jgi:hypothetical protein